jgi:hypothetical protein
MTLGCRSAIQRAMLSSSSPTLQGHIHGSSVSAAKISATGSLAKAPEYTYVLHTRYALPMASLEDQSVAGCTNTSCAGRLMFRQAEADLLRARPHLGEGHLFDEFLYKANRFKLAPWHTKCRSSLMNYEYSCVEAEWSLVGSIQM